MPNWQFYFSREKSGVACSTAVDLDLASKIPQPTRPHLMWVWVGMKHANPHGLVGAEESPVLDEIERAMAAHIQKEMDAVHVARVYRERRCEVWFYGSRTERLEEHVSAAMKPFADYHFLIGSREDPTWSTYATEFFPADPKRWHQVVNHQLLQTLKGRGDALESAHRVDHTLFFKSREGRTRFIGAARDLGYLIGGEFDARQKQELVFGVVVHQQLPRINLPLMNEAVFKLIDLSRPFGGGYDGWGTMRVRVAS